MYTCIEVVSCIHPLARFSKLYVRAKPRTTFNPCSFGWTRHFIRTACGKGTEIYYHLLTWGERDSESSCKEFELQTTYDEVVHWRKNCFKIPLGNAGKSLVDELCRLYSAFTDASALECVALRATVIFTYSHPTTTPS